jgi:hypothetical protein
MDFAKLPVTSLDVGMAASFLFRVIMYSSLLLPKLCSAK